jgi:hypothetical protein
MLATDIQICILCSEDQWGNEQLYYINERCFVVYNSSCANAMALAIEKHADNVSISAFNLSQNNVRFLPMTTT